jgi:hypothetical protein
VYSTCLFCNKPLGANEALEAFPVGRRLAFDAAKGRLWVVCKQCERWNLSPLEERWEAIEEAERLYSDTRRRVSTDNIGLAALRDGTELVRIGEPLRPEFAAWRYGDQFGRRRRRQMLIAGSGVAAFGAIVVGGAVVGVGVGGFGWMMAKAVRTIVDGSPEKVVATIQTESAGLVKVRRRHLGETVITPGIDGPFGIDLRFKNGKAHFEGREAERIASIVVPQVNRYGGGKDAIANAVGLIEASRGAEGFLERVAQRAPLMAARPTTNRRWQGRGAFSNANMSRGLFALPSSERLALEMALHEEAERKVLEGELSELERAWKEAEEIAAISDDMFVTPGIRGTIERLRSGDSK